MSRYFRFRRLLEMAALDHPGLARRLRGGRATHAPAAAGEWNRLYETGAYGELLASSHRHHHRLLAALVAERFRQPRVLDIGCGDGAFYESIRNVGPARYLGVDLSQAAIRSARIRRAADLRPGQVDFIVGDGASFTTDETFDVVIFADCVEYLPEPERLIAHYRRFLTPGGCVAVTQWLAMRPLAMWGEFQRVVKVEEDVLVQASWGGAWQVWMGRPAA